MCVKQLVNVNLVSYFDAKLHILSELYRLSRIYLECLEFYINLNKFFIFAKKTMMIEAVNTSFIK